MVSRSKQTSGTFFWEGWQDLPFVVFLRRVLWVFTLVPIAAPATWGGPIQSEQRFLTFVGNLPLRKATLPKKVI